VTDRALTTIVWALRDNAGPQNDVYGWGCRSGQFRTTWRFVTTSGSERRVGSKRCGSSVQRGCRTTCQSTPPLSRWSRHRANSPSAKSPTPTRKHSALLAVLLRSWWLLFFSMFVSLLC